MSAPDLADLTLDPNQPLQTQLYHRLVQSICNGRLTAGSKLPSSRRLSETLGVSRNTVIQVLEQLKAEGFLGSKPRQGVFISTSLPSHVAAIKEPDWQTSPRTSADDLPRLSTQGESLRNPRLAREKSQPFTPGLPDLEAFPFHIWNRLYRRHQSRLPLIGYGPSQGYLPLRQALAEYLRSSRGVRCCPDQIIITNGAQESLSLCAQVVLNPGDTVVMENPGYRRAHIAFEANRASLKMVGLKNNYLDVNALIKSSMRGKLLFTTPTHQYPMGGVMPAGDRLKLLDWAAQSGCWILEDDYDSEFSFKHRPVAALQGMAEYTPVLYMGSFSKTLQPGLRLGYLVVPKALVEVFAQAKEMLSGYSPLLSQAVVSDFIAEGHFVRHLRRMCINYREKWNNFCQLIRKDLEPQAKLIVNSAGMHVVIATSNMDDIDLSKKLSLQGFGSTPLSFFSPTKVLKSGLVLGFANTSSEDRKSCVKTLKNLLIPTLRTVLT
ncbi:PLP-dependent aminotransferase family protein [uncultured Microbulbifer sp.]|uniref:MocR-like pyridoxine biosynthesis transcription factor PdxR n=1 Tax=uncultured Microbulbifer sp. TaxID=348147 RepID=UPI00260DC9A0|nr:PLP-dependent aminotransferase family protein [uncultured Microbulbifer sp.]